MNIAIIFAGGTGQRMNTKPKPKQFLELHGKPIIIYTIEYFEQHELIDGIVIVCVEKWIDYCQKLVDKFHIEKVKAIIPGGSTGMLSRFEGVKKAKELYPDDTICLMHDGVRPMIGHDIITANIKSVEKFGSAVTVAPAIETIAVRGSDNKVGQIIDRSKCQMAKAPQSFRLGELFKVHREAIDAGMNDCIDTAYLMQLNGYDVYTVEGSAENIKITTPTDFYTFRALMDIRENSQIFGV
ncbi:MAG: 2-C-methyl-D-erythritol 4-phosphate cytidylyltransferase [Dorea sp.]|jgi:2-C-methyl-D-erythritol 4-phosphate cytidylyltransferase|nr:2-C-methyl-D-erythritol 4-phosphate cytidylyltransferase [Dorea sp.]MCI9453991.1 2-C-methyl-D-erythritol 4-phosphate cytidylyltransferase [Dorea sp.]